MHDARISLPIAVVACVIACGQGTQREPATGHVTSDANARAAGDSEEMRPAAGASAVADQIAEARCHRAQTCGQVGPGKDYESPMACRDFVRANWKADLDRLVCPGGVNDAQLHECLTQINGASCGSPFDQLERVAACTQRQICVEESR